MLHTLRNHLSLGIDLYTNFKKEIKLISNISLENSNLATELEDACKNNNGILTYEEFMMIDQFGKNGFYATSKHHGQTDIDTRWGSALAQYFYTNAYTTIIEFGCGTGELGIATAKTYKKLAKKNLNWIGVEIDKNIHKLIFKNFKNNSVQDAVVAIVESIDDLPNLQNALIVFPYSLDNIPPHVFLHTKSNTTYPDALLGIKVENNKLSEVIITPALLKKKGLTLENGLFSQNNCTFKLSGWKLRRGQRTYISTNAFATLSTIAQKCNNATLLIIDEYRKAPWSFSLTNLGTPKSLYEKNLLCHDRKRYYQQSGQHNFYFPLYKETLFKFLSTIGYRSITVDIEQKLAADLTKKHWVGIGKSYTTYAFIAKNFVEKKSNYLTIPSPIRNII